MTQILGLVLKENKIVKKLKDFNSAVNCFFFTAPTAFVAHGVAKGKKLTSYPTTKDKITGDYTYVEGERVVVDDNIVTSRVSVASYKVI